MRVTVCVRFFFLGELSARVGNGKLVGGKTQSSLTKDARQRIRMNVCLCVCCICEYVLCVCDYV